MLIPCLLLSAIFSVCFSTTSTRTAEDCTIGDQWTENYVRFECYQEAEGTVRGVRAIGCVPTNNEDGAVIDPGTTVDSQNFTHKCTKAGDVVAFNIINCRAPTGTAITPLAIGESAKSSDGSTWKCARDESGTVKLLNEKLCGCIKDAVYSLDKVYAVGELMYNWYDVELTSVDSGEKTVKSYPLTMECKSDGKGGFVAVAVDCPEVVGNKIGPVIGPQTNETYINIYTMDLACNFAVNGSIVVTVDDDFYKTCKINGTTVANGKKIYTTTEGADIYECREGLKAESLGCMYNSKKISERAVVDDGKVLKKCDQVIEGGYMKPNEWALRDLTPEEKARYDDSKQCRSTSYTGAEGSGSGHIISVKPSTTTTTVARTTRETTTTSLAPSTTTTVRRAEVTTTTTLGVVSVNTTTVPTVTSSPAPTAAPTTTTPGACIDLFDMCSTLAPICLSHHDAAVVNLKTIVKNFNATESQIKELFKAVGGDELQHSSEEDKTELEEVVRGLVGMDDESEEVDCGCRDDGCASRCRKRKRSSCKKCRIFKRKVRELVTMVCPATCGTCDSVGKVPPLIKALVRFYTHDCR